MLGLPAVAVVSPSGVAATVGVDVDVSVGTGGTTDGTGAPAEDTTAGDGDSALAAGAASVVEPWLSMVLTRTESCCVLIHAHADAAINATTPPATSTTRLPFAGTGGGG